MTEPTEKSFSVIGSTPDKEKDGETRGGEGKEERKEEEGKRKEENKTTNTFFSKDDNLGIYVENARRERGRASEGVAGWGAW